jgi:hypothetical protein
LYSLLKCRRSAFGTDCGSGSTGATRPFKIISERIVPSLNTGRGMDHNKALADARTLFEKQLDFAIRRRAREPDLSPSKADGTFAALHAIEYDSGMSEAELSQAWADVELALRNLAQISELTGMLGKANR